MLKKIFLFAAERDEMAFFYLESPLDAQFKLNVGAGE